MTKAQAAEIAERLRDLRDQSRESARRVTNRMIAEHCGVSERTVAGWLSEENPKPMTYEHCVQVAELFGVDTWWLWKGREKGPTPNVLSELDGPIMFRLNRIEEGVQKLTEMLAPIAAAQLAIDAAREKPRSRSQSAPAQVSSAKKPRAAKRRA